MRFSDDHSDRLADRYELDGKHPGILIALADEAERDQAAEWLQENYEVEVVGDGLEALGRACVKQPALLLIEPSLPNASGYAIIRSLRAAGVLTPVLVAVEHRARAVDRIRPLILGATDSISKPLHRFELCHRVQSMLQIGSSEPWPELAEAELVFLAGASSSRATSPIPFAEQCGRALRIGRRFSFDSSLVALEASSHESFELLSLAVDASLRIEDSFCVLSETRGVLLLIGSRPRAARSVVERLQSDLARRIDALAPSEASSERAAGDARTSADPGCARVAAGSHPGAGPPITPALGWRAHPIDLIDEITQASLDLDWEPLFNELQWSQEPRGRGLRARLRLLRRG